jgi:TRAP transporter TAXI family solute receptor
MHRVIVALSILAASFGAARADEVLTIATNPQGTQYFGAGAAMAKVIDAKLHRQVRVQPMAGTSTYIPLINTNEVNFGLINVDDARTAFNGVDNFQGKPNPHLRLMGVLFRIKNALLVPADSPIRRIEDVKGMRLPSGFVSQTTGKVLAAGVLATGGLTAADTKPVPVVNMFAGADALVAGRADAAVLNPGIAQVQKAHAELASHGGVRFVSINTTPEAIKRMKAVLPSEPALVNPAPHLVGVIEPTWTMAFGAFIATSEVTPPELVYDMLKALRASKAELVATAPHLEDFNPDRMAWPMPVPYHPGAIKLFTELGQWPPKD